MKKFLCNVKYFTLILWFDNSKDMRLSHSAMCAFPCWTLHHRWCIVFCNFFHVFHYCTSSLLLHLHRTSYRCSCITYFLVILSYEIAQFPFQFSYCSCMYVCMYVCLYVCMYVWTSVNDMYKCLLLVKIRDASIK